MTAPPTQTPAQRIAELEAELAAAQRDRDTAIEDRDAATALLPVVEAMEPGRRAAWASMVRDIKDEHDSQMQAQLDAVAATLSAHSATGLERERLKKRVARAERLVRIQAEEIAELRAVIAQLRRSRP